jgi:hypothetical protein
LPSILQGNNFYIREKLENGKEKFTVVWKDAGYLNYGEPENPEAETPEEPDTPVEPEVPAESVGSITEDNSIVIDETRLENGTYTLRYIDSNENAIDNFNEITTFEINQ